MELKLTPTVLFRAIGAVAGAIGPKCEAKMMHEAIAASAEESNAVPANVDLRDYFAAHAPAMETPALEVAEALTGRKLPEGRMEREIFWLDVDAEQRHLWAEAMLRARKDPA